MSAKTQLKKEIMEAIIFLREHNNTIPSETIEYMKQASLSQLKQDTEDPEDPQEKENTDPWTCDDCGNSVYNCKCRI